MVSVNLKFWYDDFSEEDITVVIPCYPQKGDTITYKKKYYTVESRGFDLDTGVYTKVHCKPYKNRSV